MVLANPTSPQIPSIERESSTYSSKLRQPRLKLLSIIFNIYQTTSCLFVKVSRPREDLLAVANGLRCNKHDGSEGCDDCPDEKQSSACFPAFRRGQTADFGAAVVALADGIRGLLEMHCGWVELSWVSVPQGTAKFQGDEGDVNVQNTLSSDLGG
jgi:hypothetical protein